MHKQGPDSYRLSLVVMLVFMGMVMGCQVTPSQHRASPQRLVFENPAGNSVSTNPVRAPGPTSHESVQQASFENSPEMGKRRQTSTIAVGVNTRIPGQRSGLDAPMTIQDFQNRVLSSHPKIAELAARIDSLEGKKIQAGLPPNPNGGVLGEDINEDRLIGRYGLFYSQKSIRGNKLRLAESVVSSEIDAAKQALSACRMQLKADAKIRYFDFWVARRRVRIAEELQRIATQSVATSKVLVDAKEVARPALLQAELELANADVTLAQSKNREVAARRKLAALIGEDDVDGKQMVGGISDEIIVDDFEKSFDRLVNQNPEIEKLFAEVVTSRRQLALDKQQWVPDVTWQTSLMYNYGTNDLVGGFQIGMPIPGRNLNQGKIHQSHLEIVARERKVESRILSLRQQLVSAYELFTDSKIQMEALKNDMLPKARETLKLVQAGFQQGEVPYLQLLTTQRTFTQTNLIYLDRLNELWRSAQHIESLLLATIPEMTPSP